MQSNSNGSAEPSSSSSLPLMQLPAVAVVAAGVQFVSQALKGADGLGGPRLAPALLGFLPSLLRLQVPRSPGHPGMGASSKETVVHIMVGWMCLRNVAASPV